MKALFVVFALIMSYPCMALTTVYDGAIYSKKSLNPIPYIKLDLTQDEQKKVVNSNDDLMPEFPIKSQLQAGVFKSYQLSKCQRFPVSFFVIGPDALSLNWLKQHKKHLKDIHALGFITNVDSLKELKESEKHSPIQLLPTNIDGLARVLNVPAYPFLTNGCEVWQ